MPQPALTQVHIDRWMTNFAIRYRQSASKFVGISVFPTLPTQTASNDYLIFPKGYWMRDDMPVRGIGEEPAYDGYQVETGKFFCEERALRYIIDDRITVNADDPLLPAMRATEWLTERSLIKLDREWCSSFFKEGVWSTNWEGVTGSGSESGKTFTQFSDEGTEPIAFFNRRSDEMEGSTGVRPNVMVLGATAYTDIRNNKEVVNRVKFISQHEPALVGMQALAAAFEVDKIVVAKSVYNSAAEGLTEKIEFIANPTSALLAFAAPAPSLDTPSAGYIFAWTSLVPGIGPATAGVLYSGRLEQAWSDWYAIRSAYDMKVTAPELGIYFSDVVAAA